MRVGVAYGRWFEDAFNRINGDTRRRNGTGTAVAAAEDNRR